MPVKHHVTGLCGHPVLIIELIPWNVCEGEAAGRGRCYTELRVRVEDRSNQDVNQTDRLNVRPVLCDRCEPPEGQPVPEPLVEDDPLVYVYPVEAYAEGTPEYGTRWERRSFRLGYIPEWSANLADDEPMIRDPQQLPNRNSTKGLTSRYFPNANPSK